MLLMYMTLSELEYLLKQPKLEFTYTNWKGETRQRSCEPLNIEYKRSPFHGKEKQLVLVGNDLEKQQIREYLCKDIVFDKDI